VTLLALACVFSVALIGDRKEMIDAYEAVCYRSSSIWRYLWIFLKYLVSLRHRLLHICSFLWFGL